MSGIITPQMIKAGFEVPEIRETKRVFALTQGPEKCGKTDWVLRDAPQPIAGVSFDTGTRELVEKFLPEKPEIYLHEQIVPKQTASPKDRAARKDTQTIAQKVLEGFLEANDAVLQNPKIRTYFWDTGTEAWELYRLAEFGTQSNVKELYGVLNNKFRGLIKDIYKTRPDLNFICIHKMKKQWAKDKKGESGWTGKYERAGFDDMRYLVDVCLSHHYDYPGIEDEGEERQFGIKVVDEFGVGARSTADCAGLELWGEECSFFYLAMNLFPEVDPEYWDDGSPNHPLR